MLRCNGVSREDVHFRSSNTIRPLASLSANIAFIRFVIGEWKKTQHRQKRGKRVLYTTCNCKITKVHCELTEELKSTKEETDKCMFLHAPDASEAGNITVGITADVADVLPICIVSKDKYLMREIQKRSRLTDIWRLVGSDGESVCRTLTGLCFSRCDAVNDYGGQTQTA